MRNGAAGGPGAATAAQADWADALPAVRVARHARIAGRLEQDIQEGRLRPGSRLPPIRRLARELGVSGATVAAAYELLARRGWVRGEVGRGTFVRPPAGAASSGLNGSGAPAALASPGHLGAPAAIGRVGAEPARAPWRRRAMNTFVARLRAAYPDALDCTSGRPDVGLLPAGLLTRAWRATLDALQPEDVQYAGAEPLAILVEQVLPLLAADGIRAGAGEIAVGNSAQQLMMLALDALDLQRAGGVVPLPLPTAGGAPRIAVEEPGFFTAYDTFERRGYAVAGVAVDAEGAVPHSLHAALEAGTAAVLLTPRAHNPTGASWTAERARALADVLARFPGVLIVEDDFSGVAVARPGSLFMDPRLADRVIHIRSFSKSIAPDLRVAIAVARPPLRLALTEAKSYADGWTSCLAQRVLARVLADPALPHALAAARYAYATRRAAFTAAVDTRLGAGAAQPAADGVAVWVRLPPGADAAHVIEHAAPSGALFAPGEPFFIRAGHGEAVRVNAGVLSPEQAERAGHILADAALAAVASTSATPPAMV